jgi:hypothetical protein
MRLALASAHCTTTPYVRTGRCANPCTVVGGVLPDVLCPA